MISFALWPLALALDMYESTVPSLSATKNLSSENRQCEMGRTDVVRYEFCVVRLEKSRDHLLAVEIEF